MPRFERLPSPDDRHRRSELVRQLLRTGSPRRFARPEPAGPVSRARAAVRSALRDREPAAR